MQYAQGLVFLTGLAAAGVVYAQNFTANTPASLTQCRPVQLTWTGGVAPYFPRITAPADINTILQDFGSVTGTSVTWTINQPAGQTVTFSVGDSAGNTANSGVSPAILEGSDDCLDDDNNSSSSAAAAPSTSAASSSASSAASSSTAAASSSASRPSSSSASASRSLSSAAPSPTASTTPNGANSVRGASAIVAGVVGVAVAALL